MYHYTAKSTFHTIFPKPPPPHSEKLVRKVYAAPKLLLSPTELLNDPSEGLHFFKILRNDLKDLELIDGLNHHRLHTRAEFGLNATDPLVFVASLCMEEDNLNLWRFYSDGARGVCFGVHRSQFDLDTEEGLSDGDHRDKIYRVKYGPLEVKRALNHLMPALINIDNIYKNLDFKKFQPHITKSVIGILNSVAYLFKTKSYAAEQECRLLRIQSIGEARASSAARTIEGMLRIESKVEFVHGGKRGPRMTLGPQFDMINPERGQTMVIDRIRFWLRNRQPTVRLSAMQFRASEEPVPVE